MAKVLTSAAVAKLKVRDGEKRREVKDGASTGLYLIIQASGHKSWGLRFRKPSTRPGRPGTPAKLTLGPVDFSGAELVGAPVIGQPLSLPAARQLAAEVHRQRAMGRDVVVDAKADKKKLVAVDETFGALARLYVKEHAMRETRRWQATARALGLKYKDKDAEPEVVDDGIVDLWKDKPASSITVSDVHVVVDGARDDIMPGAGMRRRKEKTSDAAGRSVTRTLSKLFGWLAEKRKITANPVAGTKAPRPARPKSRVLTDDEIQKFWRAAGQELPVFSSPLKLLLLTGCRVNEIAGLRRAELSGDAINLPESRTKNHRAHVVPLAPLAGDLIPEGDGACVFSTTRGIRPVQLGSKLKHRLDARMAIAPWTLHDLRRTAATGMARLRIAPHVIEAVLNHVSGAKASVADIYNVYQYEDEKKAALERWASHVEGVVSGRPVSNVVSIGRAS
jgi:integrase